MKKAVFEFLRPDLKKIVLFLFLFLPVFYLELTSIYYRSMIEILQKNPQLIQVVVTLNNFISFLFFNVHTHLFIPLNNNYIRGIIPGFAARQVAHFIYAYLLSSLVFWLYPKIRSKIKKN